MKRSICFMLIFSLGIFATVSNGYDGTQTNNDYIVEINVNDGIVSLELNVNNGSFVNFARNYAVVSFIDRLYEPTDYSVIGHKPYDLALFNGCFNPKGQFA